MGPNKIGDSLRLYRITSRFARCRRWDQVNLARASSDNGNFNIFERRSQKSRYCVKIRPNPPFSASSYMKNRIEIRKITLRSLDAFYTFFKKNFALLFPEYNKKEIRFILKARWGWSRKRYRELLEEKDRIILGAYDGRKIVGILDAELPEAGVSECDWIMVHKDYQGKGIGKELMKEWERI